MKEFPNSPKFKKSHKKKLFKGRKGTSLAMYTTGIKIKQNAYLTSRQYEVIRVLINRKLRPKRVVNKKHLKLIQSARKQYKVNKKKKKKGKTPFMLLRYNFCLPLTKKPLQVRMGKGKGSPYKWVHPLTRSGVIMEMSRKRHKLKFIYKLYNRVRNKLPKRTKFIFSKSFLRRELNFYISSTNNGK